MKFIEIIKRKDEFITVWNDEFGEYYPISERLFNEAAIFSEHIVHQATKALIINEKFIGLIIAKIYKGKIPIESYSDTGFISLIYVRKDERGKGYGKALLNMALKELNQLGLRHIHLGTDINNFFPGLPKPLATKQTLSFLESFSFKQVGRCYNLIMSKNPNFRFDTTYNQRQANLNDKKDLLDFIKKEFSKRWYYEAYNYFQKGGTGREFVLLLDQDRIIGFARINDKHSIQIMHNINWSKRYKNLGGIGPLGIAKKYRGQKLGTRIIIFGTQILFGRGCSDVLVDWTGIHQFYEKSGFKICDEFISYTLELNEY